MVYWVQTSYLWVLITNSLSFFPLLFSAPPHKRVCTRCTYNRGDLQDLHGQLMDLAEVLVCI